MKRGMQLLIACAIVTPFGMSLIAIGTIWGVYLMIAAVALFYIGLGTVLYEGYGYLGPLGLLLTSASIPSAFIGWLPYAEKVRVELRFAETYHHYFDWEMFTQEALFLSAGMITASFVALAYGIILMLRMVTCGQSINGPRSA